MKHILTALINLAIIALIALIIVDYDKSYLYCVLGLVTLSLLKNDKPVTKPAIVKNNMVLFD